ncbi:MAG: class I SAM-dependent methyltransferase [Thermoleophilia bacterium]|jgi:precorrin-6B methylase 2
MDFESIDWEAMWRQECARSPWKDGISAKERWDKRAAEFNKGVGLRNEQEDPSGNKSDYISKMLERIRIRPDWTVLDIGCGPGTLALSLAQRAKRVTGLDVSSEMLRLLRQNAQAAGLDNIECMNAGWQDALSDGRIEAHDVVVASRSLYGAEIRNALRAMDTIARHGVYVTLPVIPHSFDYEAYAAIGRLRGQHPPYIYVLNMLYQMGIKANLELLESEKMLTFASVEDAIEQMSWRTYPFSDEEHLKLREFLGDTFVTQTGPPFVQQSGSIWALIWWEKRG